MKQRNTIQDQEACDNEEDTYIDPSNGLTVLTSHFLKQRGFCCHGDCRHCPYRVNKQDHARIIKHKRE